jgi:glycerol-3-phosphate dehydrogenase subunit C
VATAGGGADNRREGSLEAPTRLPLAWREPSFYDEAALEQELARVFDVCHGCRRCFSLCQSFPTLFDAIDESPTGELHGVPKSAYWKVVDHCYLCDLCAMTKCPYVPPHPWNIDFPRLMLRAKAVRFRRDGASFRDRMLTDTDRVGTLAGIPVVAQAVNAANASRGGRKLLDKVLHVHPEAPLPRFHTRTARARLRSKLRPAPEPQATPETTGKVVLFTTCYGNRNDPDLVTDLAAVFAHNGIVLTLAASERCCGMPKLEIGDLESVERLMKQNVPQLVRLLDQGYDIVAPIPSCVLMFKQELPLLYPHDLDVQRVRQHVFDPAEYLMLRHKAGLVRTDFKAQLGKVSYHVPCHQRVQNIGLKTRDLLRLVPGTTVDVIERCSGHDGSYAVKSEFREASVRIGRPVAQRVEQGNADYYSSDCPMAGEQFRSILPAGARDPAPPFKLLRIAYGI